MTLQVAPNVSLSQLSWTIHNSSLLSTDLSGNVDLSQSPAIAFVVSGLPAGPAYTIALSGTASSGLSCAGTAAFDISGSVTTAVMDNLVCYASSVDAGNLGAVNVSATATVANWCAAVSALSANPLSVNVGGSISLSAAGIDSYGSGADVGLSWSVTGGGGTGTFSSTNSAATTFNCASAGPVIVTVGASVQDAGAPNGVNCTDSTSSITLSCLAATVDSGLDDAGSPVDAGAGESDSDANSCPPSYTACGNRCCGSNQICQAGSCIPGPPGG
jgi:hypothetical protein